MVLDFGQLLTPIQQLALTQLFGEPELSPGATGILAQNQERSEDELRALPDVTGEFAVGQVDEDSLMVSRDLLFRCFT